ncbi:class I SAM-dependent methyltransferase [Thalassorhabdomicrobium marinisediminis]|uniref:class I SAM-dependent methyltransferase n=1 Tax=Thalassorhabdomicrobium marinisediminis TaxID=2170577 RepID=UPI0024900221|nr:class I SAM-dependent methyltransferase [Thalassorhabdomicrobium marinisediminis]
MVGAEFDAYVKNYAEQHSKSIRFSGEEPEYFAEYKVRELARLVSDWGCDTPNVLDFGSGMGNSLPAFRKYFPGNPITASDVSEASLKAAVELHGPQERQLIIGSQTIPAEASSFDVVFSACVFHHIPEKEHIDWLVELRRVTRKGGHIVIFEHNPINPFTQHAVRRCPFDENAVLISPREMRSRLRKSGWLSPKTDYHIFFPAAFSKMRVADRYLRWCGIGGQYACHAVAPK